MKYMGSKASIAKHIMPIILKNRSTNQWYVEPFAGGMNSMIYAYGKRIANDINPYVIAMWRQLISGWYPPKISKDLYHSIKNNKHRYSDHLVGWAGIGCSYSGKWFGGYAGITRTIEGIRDYQDESISHATGQAKSLKNIVLTAYNYQDVTIPPNSIVYCDPEYKGVTGYDRSINHTLFWDWVRFISRNNRVYVSEYQAPCDFECLWSSPVQSSLSNAKSKLSIERLYTWKR